MYSFDVVWKFIYAHFLHLPIQELTGYLMFMVTVMVVPSLFLNV